MGFAESQSGAIPHCVMLVQLSYSTVNPLFKSPPLSNGNLTPFWEWIPSFVVTGELAVDDSQVYNLFQ